ncbi:hypothetical protein SAMN05192574_1239 [Mucilaginibacter gossypiicola]|uniref:Uncharacterized protein n=1 Tax=Mucilaginibacter gossypiicola TaxID=551995 RepID=A0A1H8V7I0_9SPHI|nr:hypothetical protein SAMN05192574_1239 [Mucilaginibacter gossypiicola]
MILFRGKEGYPYNKKVVGDNTNNGDVYNKHVIARSKKGMRPGATWQSHAVQSGYASVRLLRASQ